MQFETSMESKTLDAMPWEEPDWWWIPTGVCRWWTQNNSWEAARDSPIDALHDNLLMNNTFLWLEHPSRYSFPGSILQGNKLNLHGTRKMEEDWTESCFSFLVLCASSDQSINQLVLLSNVFAQRLLKSRTFSAIFLHRAWWDFFLLLHIDCWDQFRFAQKSHSAITQNSHRTKRELIFFPILCASSY